MDNLNLKPAKPEAISSPLKITLIYFIVAALWIFLSDFVLSALVSDAASMKWISIYKGWFFVIITGGLLFFLIKRADVHKAALQKELEKSEQKYRTIVETFYEEVWTFDEAGRITFINGACRNLFGLTPDEMTGNIFLQYVAPERRKPDSEYFKKKVTDGGEMIDYETMVINKEGVQKDVIVNAVILKQDGGKSAAYGTILDITDRKKSEELLITSEKKYRSIVETANEGIWITDKENKTTFVNRTQAKMLGYEVRDMIGRSIFEFIELIDVSDTKERLLLGKSGVSSLHEFRLRRKNDESIWILMNVTPIFDKDENFEGSLLMLTDINDRKLAQDALKESENKYKTLIDTSPSSIRLIDLSGKLLYCNRQTAIIHGYENIDEMIGMSVFELMKGENKTISKNALQKIIDFGFASGELVFCRKDGSEFPGEYHSSLLSDEIGRPIGIISIVNDISDKKKAQQEVLESRERLSGILDSAMDAIITTDEHRKIVLFNKSAEKLFKCSEQNAIGQDVNIFIPERFHRSHNLHYERFSEAGASKTTMVTGNNLIAAAMDGKEIPVETSVSKTEIAEKKYFTVILRDITERIKYEEDLKDTNSKLHLLASHLQNVREEERLLISRDIHDQVGQELTALKMDMVMLAKELEKNPALKQTHQVINELRSMAELTDKSIKWIRNLSTELRPDVIDRLGLFECIDWHCKEFQRRSGINCGVKLEGNDSDLSKEHSIVFFRILQESLTNVLRHSGASQVEVFMREEDGILTLNVKDNGKGITKEKLVGASSLGLIGMKERAYMLGGTVNINSEEGKGVTITASIPKMVKAEYD